MARERPVRGEWRGPGDRERAHCHSPPSWVHPVARVMGPGAETNDWEEWCHETVAVVERRRRPRGRRRGRSGTLRQSPSPRRGGLDHRSRRRRRLVADLGLESRAIGLAIDHEVVGVVAEAVEGALGEQRVVEDGQPFGGVAALPPLVTGAGSPNTSANGTRYVSRRPARVPDTQRSR